jgi:hypothetical protein
MSTDLNPVGKAGSAPQGVANGGIVGPSEKNNSIKGIVVVKENQYHVANIRNYPGFKNTAVIAKEVPGAQLSYFDRSNDKRWYKVASSNGKKIGWIFNTLVKEQPATTQIKPEAPAAPAAAVEEKLDPEKKAFFISSITDLPVSTLIEIAEAAANGIAKDVYITQYDPKTYTHYSKTFSPKEISLLLQDASIKEKFGNKALGVIKADPEVYAAYGDHFNALKPFLALTTDQNILSFNGLKDGKETPFIALIEKKGQRWVLYGADKVGFAVDEIKEENGAFSIIEKHVLFGKGKLHPAVAMAVSKQYQPSSASAAGTVPPVASWDTPATQAEAEKFIHLFSVNADVKRILTDKMIDRTEAKELGISDELFDLIDNSMAVGGKGDGKITLQEIGKFNIDVDKYAKVVCDGNRDMAVEMYKAAKGFEMRDLNAVEDASAGVAGALGITGASIAQGPDACFSRLSPEIKAVMVRYFNGLSASDRTVARISLRLASLVLIAQLDDASQDKLLGTHGLPKFDMPITPETVSNYLLQEKRLAEKKEGEKAEEGKRPAQGPDNTPAVIVMGGKKITRKQVDDMVEYIKEGDAPNIPGKKVSDLTPAAQKKYAIGNLLEQEAANILTSKLKDEDIKAFLVENDLANPSSEDMARIKQDRNVLPALIRWAITKKKVSLAEFEKERKTLQVAFADTSEGKALQQEVGDIFKKNAPVVAAEKTGEVRRKKVIVSGSKENATKAPPKPNKEAAASLLDGIKGK